MNSKSKIIISYGLTATLYFFGGLFIEKPHTSGAAAGDVSRIKVSTESVIPVDVDHLQNRLMSDSLMNANLAKKAHDMQAFSYELLSLYDKSNELLADKQAFETVLEEVNSSYSSVKNACAAIDTYAGKLGALSKGAYVVEFEQSYNNALLGYFLVSRKAALAEMVSESASSYLANAEAANYDEIKQLWGRWMNFEIQDKMNNGDLKAANDLSFVCAQNGIETKLSFQDQPICKSFNSGI